jgi:mRNA interferase HigB
MHVVAFKKLRQSYQQYPEIKSQLKGWYKIARKAEWNSLVDLRRTFPSADQVGNFTVFNIVGNNYRLIVDIIYSRN